MIDPNAELTTRLRSLGARLEELAKLTESPVPEGEEADFGKLEEAIRACRATLEEVTALIPVPGGKGPPILVVDDDRVSRDILVGFLGRYGEVTAAASGAEAMAAVTRAVRSGKHFRLIFLDLMMPEMDGHEVLRRIRGVEEVYSTSTPSVVAMTTAMGDRGTVLRARQGGSEGYFVKPIDLAKLGDWVEAQGLPGG